MDPNSEDVFDSQCVPGDRKLTLLSKLEYGWSSIAKNPDDPRGETRPKINREEMNHIESVFRRNQSLQQREKNRVKLLIEESERTVSQCLGDGIEFCVLCGERDGVINCIDFHDCVKCDKLVCSRCSFQHGSCPSYLLESFICALCWQRDMLYKRSGIWFYQDSANEMLSELSNLSYRIFDLFNSFSIGSNKKLCR